LEVYSWPKRKGWRKEDFIRRDYPKRLKKKPLLEGKEFGREEGLQIRGRTGGKPLTEGGFKKPLKGRRGWLTIGLTNLAQKKKGLLEGLPKGGYYCHLVTLGF